MKEVISIVIITFLLNLFSACNSLKQADKKYFDYYSPVSIDVLSPFPDTLYFQETQINNVNIKAVRNFRRSFKKVTNEKWYKISNGFVSSFTVNDAKTQIMYNINGDWLFTVITYYNGQMSLDAKDLLKDRYDDFLIQSAYELKYNRDTVYVVKIENKTKLQIIQITHRKIEVMVDGTKG